MADQAAHRGKRWHRRMSCHFLERQASSYTSLPWAYDLLCQNCSIYPFELYRIYARSLALDKPYLSI